MFRRIRQWVNAEDHEQRLSRVAWSPSGGITTDGGERWKLDIVNIRSSVLLNELYRRLVEVDGWPQSEQKDEELGVLAALMRTLLHGMAKEDVPIPPHIRNLAILQDDMDIEVTGASVGNVDADHVRRFGFTYRIGSGEQISDASVSGDLVSAPYKPRPGWADPSNSTWEDYEEFFFYDKENLPNIPAWRSALRVCHAHWNLERRIIETYRRREVDGVEFTIPICREQIALAPEAKIALEIHYQFNQEYVKNIYKEAVEQWKQWNSNPYPGYAPVDTPFTLPEHRGFKQLTIIYDKMKDYETAIDVCQAALAIDWPGDWDVRIARYTRRLKNASKSKGRAVVSGNVIVIDTKPTDAPRFCVECGSELKPTDLFCGNCGAKRTVN